MSTPSLADWIDQARNRRRVREAGSGRISTFALESLRADQDGPKTSFGIATLLSLAISPYHSRLSAASVVQGKRGDFLHAS